jgi:chromate transporter
MTEPDGRGTGVMTRPTMTALVNYFLYLGSLGFGGPVALVGYMQRDLVERRAWFTKEEYMKSLALSQLAPGRWPRSWRSVSAACTPGSRGRP